jgi:FhuF-like iron-sulfur protein
LSESLAALGPYFTVGRHDPSVAPEGGWRPLQDLLSSADPLGERSELVRAALSLGSGQQVELRVAASVAHLGLAARLIAPVFAAAVLDAKLLVLDDARWLPVLGGPVLLSLPDDVLAGIPFDGPLSGSLASTVIDGPVRALVHQAEVIGVPPKVAWGNVASGVNGAAAMVAGGRPERAAAVLSLAGDLLAEPALRGRSKGEPGKNFRRRSCCLIYRVAPRGPRVVCGDCILENSR